jgi:hypothetical protein
MPDRAVAAGPAGRPRPSRPRQGGGWAFHYDAGTKVPDEIGFHFADQRFAAGEYVSINEGGPGWQVQLVFIMMSVQNIGLIGMALVVLVAVSSRLRSLVVFCPTHSKGHHGGTGRRARLSF